MTAEQINTLTGGNVRAALLVLAALAALFLMLGQIINLIIGWRRPAARKEDALLAHQHACSKRFRADMARLDKLEKEIDQLRASDRAQCAALRALLEHALHNGNADEMQEASKNLFNHLNGR